VLAGIILYAFLNARRERLSQIPEPAGNPPDGTAAPAPADTQRERVAGIRRDVMRGAAPFRVGKWLPSDQQVLGRWLDDLIAKADARGDVPLLPVVEEFRQLIERDPEIYMLFAFMLTQTPRKLTPADKPQVRTVDHMLKLFNHILTHAPEYDDTGLVGTPINAILDWASRRPG
jgi:phosphatidylserine decarboxylase